MSRKVVGVRLTESQKNELAQFFVALPNLAEYLKMKRPSMYSRALKTPIDHDDINMVCWFRMVAKFHKYDKQKSGIGTFCEKVIASAVSNERKYLNGSTRKCPSRLLSLNQSYTSCNGTTEDFENCDVGNIIEDKSHRNHVYSDELEVAGKKSCELLKVLDKRAQELIKLRFGIGHDRPHSYREVASKFNISNTRVVLIEKAAIEKMKKHAVRMGM